MSQCDYIEFVVQAKRREKSMFSLNTNINVDIIYATLLTNRLSDFIDLKCYPHSEVFECLLFTVFANKIKDVP